MILAKASSRSRVRDAFDLVEAGESVSHVIRIGQRFLALPREGEHAVRQLSPVVNHTGFGMGIQVVCMASFLLGHMRSAFLVPCQLIGTSALALA